MHRADAFDRSEDIKIESALRGKSGSYMRWKTILHLSEQDSALRNPILHPPSLVGMRTRHDASATSAEAKVACPTSTESGLSH